MFTYKKQNPAFNRLLVSLLVLTWGSFVTLPCTRCVIGDCGVTAQSQSSHLSSQHGHGNPTSVLGTLQKFSKYFWWKKVSHKPTGIVDIKSVAAGTANKLIHRPNGMVDFRYDRRNQGCCFWCYQLVFSCLFEGSVPTWRGCQWLLKVWTCDTVPFSHFD